MLDLVVDRREMKATIARAAASASWTPRCAGPRRARGGVRRSRAGRRRRRSQRSPWPPSTDLARPRLRASFGIKLGPRRTSARSSRRSVIPSAPVRRVLVAGTNGKGSVTAMVERALRAAGRRTGRYTSPHLVHLEERFAIDGEPVDARRARRRRSRDVLGDRSGLPRRRPAAPSRPTFFEATTAVALRAVPAARGRHRGDRSRPRRPLRRHQRRDADGHRDRLDRFRSPGAISATRSRPSPSRRPASPSRASRWSSAISTDEALDGGRAAARRDAARRWSRAPRAWSASVASAADGHADDHAATRRRATYGPLRAGAARAASGRPTRSSRCALLEELDDAGPPRRRRADRDRARGRALAGPARARRARPTAGACCSMPRTTRRARARWRPSSRAPSPGARRAGLRRGARQGRRRDARGARAGRRRHRRHAFADARAPRRRRARRAGPRRARRRRRDRGRVHVAATPAAALDAAWRRSATSSSPDRSSCSAGCFRCSAGPTRSTADELSHMAVLSCGVVLVSCEACARVPFVRPARWPRSPSLAWLAPAALGPGAARRRRRDRRALGRQIAPGAARRAPLPLHGRRRARARGAGHPLRGRSIDYYDDRPAARRRPRRVHTRATAASRPTRPTSTRRPAPARSSTPSARRRSARRSTRASSARRSPTPTSTARRSRRSASTATGSPRAASPPASSPRRAGR